MAFCDGADLFHGFYAEVLRGEQPPDARGDQIMEWMFLTVNRSIIPELKCSKQTGFHSIWLVTSVPPIALLSALNLKGSKLETPASRISPAFLGP